MPERTRKSRTSARSRQRSGSSEQTLRDLIRRERSVDKPLLLELTQTSNANLLVAMYGSQIHYCYPAKKWYVWVAVRWCEDNGGVMGRAAKQVVHELRDRAGEAGDEERTKQILKWAHKCQSAAQQEAMLKLACSEPGISILPEDFDRDSWLLGLPNGTLELRTRTFRSSRPEDLITKICGVP